MRFVTAILFLTVALGQERPVFEVASVKTTSHGRDANGLSISDMRIVSPGRLRGTNSSLSECIRFAWDLKDYQLEGPAWLNDDDASYDIEAKAPPTTSEAQMRQMLQFLLAERLGVRVHRSTRDTRVYNLLAPGGVTTLHTASATRESDYLSTGGSNSVRITSEAGSLRGLAERLTRDLERPVFDKTGIAGLFEVDLMWSRGEGDGPSIFAVLRDAGLKLESSKASVEIIVVDNANKVPTAN